MPASEQHPDYDNNLDSWQLVRDAVDGSNAIKTRSGGGSNNTGSLNGAAGTKYLPAPNASDTTAGNKARYDAYKLRANYVNFTGMTSEGISGLIFRKDAEIEMPLGLEFIKEDATGSCLPLDQVLRGALANLMETGRYGFLVDYPEAEEGLTNAQVQALGLRPNVLTYTAESIINWRYEVINGCKRPTLIVLREEVDKCSDDGFSFERVEYHRVLRMMPVIDKEGKFDDPTLFYASMTYNEHDELIKGPVYPRKSDGTMWSEIPFQFVGSTNNDEVPDKAPLYDIAQVNIAHYRNSADYEESSFMVGQPTPVLGGLTPAWIDKTMKNGVALGSRTAILLPKDGNAALLQAAPNTMPSEGMKAKEQQMIAIGARLIQNQGGVETAEAAKIRFAGQNSKMTVLIGNLESGLEQVMTWVKDFAGIQGDHLIKINRDFYDKSVNPQMVIAKLQLLDRKVIAKADIRAELRTAGVIAADRTDEMIDDESDMDSPI